MTDTRPELPDPPARVEALRVDHRGYPVPWFVAWMDGQMEVPVGQGVPDFRVIGSGRIHDAIRRKRCWICGQSLGRNLAYVVGPMCAVNRVNSEPPSHLECALYAAVACPFLSRPHMVRRENDIPEDAEEPAGYGIKRNPGVAVVWVTRDAVRPFPVDDEGGILFHIGDAHTIFWVAEGRPATREEVMASLQGGLPALMKAAVEQSEGAVKQLEQQVARTLEIIPT